MGIVVWVMPPCSLVGMISVLEERTASGFTPEDLGRLTMRTFWVQVCKIRFNSPVFTQTSEVVYFLYVLWILLFLPCVLCVHSVWYGVLLLHYNFGRVLAFSTIAFHLRRSWTCSVHFISFTLLMSFLTSSPQRDLRLLTGLLVNGFHLYTGCFKKSFTTEEKARKNLS
jgi:hypothetical protein